MRRIIGVLATLCALTFCVLWLLQTNGTKPDNTFVLTFSDTGSDVIVSMENTQHFLADNVTIYADEAVLPALVTEKYSWQGGTPQAVPINDPLSLNYREGIRFRLTRESAESKIMVTYQVGNTRFKESYAGIGLTR